MPEKPKTPIKVYFNHLEDISSVFFAAIEDIFKKPSQTELDDRLQGAVLGNLERYAMRALDQGADANARLATTGDREAAQFNDVARRNVESGPLLLKIASENKSQKIVSALLKAGATP